MRQQIIIPWRDTGEPWRKRHFDFLFKYYSDHYEVILGDNEGEFNRSAARNNGVSSSSSEVSVIIDADNFIPINQIEEAITLASNKKALVKPFSSFGYLTEESTYLFYEYFDELFVDFSPTYIDEPQEDFTGGAYVMRKCFWQELGGMDEGFIGWGAEDDAFHILCKAMNIKIRYIDGVDYHLYHPAFRVTSEFNYNKLIKDYVRNYAGGTVKWRLGK
jgi:predicted glycosyltransferase involved in capsule biosynthesis